MRKIFTFLIVIISFLPFLVSAQFTEGSIPTPGDFGVEGASSVPTDVDGLLNILRAVVKFAYIAFFIVAVIFIIFAAFNYLTGADAPDKIKAAHAQLIYSIIAIAIALLALAIQLVIGNLLSGAKDGGNVYPSTEEPLNYPINYPVQT